MKAPIFVRQNIRTVLGFVLAILICVVLLSLVMHLRRARLNVPFVYHEDALLHSMFIKGMIDNGWYVNNPYLGAPGHLQLYDFPVAENLHMLVIKTLTVFTSDYATVLNLYFLLSFPLITITSLYVFRQFEVSYPPALAGSLLYTFLPFHFLRNEHHLFLAAYYLIPLVVLVVLWVADGFTLFTRGAGGRALRIQFSKRFVISLVVCAAVGSSGVYYPFFTCLLILVAGALASVLRRSALPAFSAIALLAVITLFVFINLLPSVIHSRRHGDVLTATRHVGESELFGLNISQLVLPITYHRVPLLARLKHKFNRSAPAITENDFASLGFVGAVGFLFLVGGVLLRFRAFAADGRQKLFEQLGILNIAAVLFATIGGFGTLFAVLISPRIRSYNRMSVFIAFFSLFAICLLLDTLCRRYVKSRASQIIFYAVVAVIIAAGVFDQTGKSHDYQPDFARARAHYFSDRAMVQYIEAQLPRGTMVFQLPYARFPEQGQIQSMGDYSHFRGYLHSHSLRWSYGAMRSRADDAWQNKVAAQPVEGFLKAISSVGFDGILINREGYADNGAGIETEISSLLGVRPLVSKAGDLSFFNLAELKERLKRSEN